MRVIFILSTILLLLSSCTKEPGIGGNSSISGKVIIQELDPFTGEVSQEYEAPEERVYIIYGDNEIYDDEIRTHYDGRFKFTDLYKGSYTLYVYSDCNTCPSGTIPVMRTVEIEENNSDLLIQEDIIIND